MGPESELTLVRLEAATESGACFASVHVHLSARERWPPPSDTPSRIVSALAGSAATLTALHGLPLMEGQLRSAAGLGAFTRLRALSLLQATQGSELRSLQAAQLPTALEQLKLTQTVADPSLPIFADLDRLSSLRQLTFADNIIWDSGADRQNRRPLRVPPSFQVFTVV